MTATSGTQYLYLRPADPPLAPRPQQILLPHAPTDREVDAALCSLGTEPVHLDFETTGLEVCDPEQRVVGIGLANSRGRVYLDVRHWRERADEWRAFFDWLNHVGYWAFNAGFDYAWCYRYAQARHTKLLGCTHVLFKLLANEGHPGQRHSLDTAMRQVLRWPESQKDTLDALLIKHGITLQNGNADKGRMSELADLEPIEFSRYCALDAEASWQLQQVLEPQARQSTAWRFATREWPCSIRLKCEAQWHGVRVEREKLAAFHADLSRRIDQTVVDLRAHPRLSPHIVEAETGWAAEAAKPHVTEARVKVTKAEVEERCQKGDHPEDWWFEPSQAKTLAKWQRELGGYWYYIKYTERPSTKKAKSFNFESDHDLRWLLYARIYPNVAKDAERRIAKVQFEEGRSVEVNLTETGLVPVGKDILPALGEVGALLGKYNQLTKLGSYVRSYLVISERDGRWHIDLRAHGAATGRWGGGSGAKGSANWQQLPKVPGVLGCFVADPGHVLVQTDINALEPRVVATFSGDRTMLELFASGKPHDTYLYVSAALFPDKRAAIDAVYRLDAPTAESVDAAKAEFKAQRKIGKGIHLAAGYGAGAPKMWRTLQLAGISVSLDEVKVMKDRYWDLFAGVRRWTKGLEREREDRGGWIYNGHGRPLAIPEMRVKDLGNAFAQSTGHDCLLIYLWHIDRLRTERGIPMRPWSSNEHDATVWQAPTEHGEAAAQVLRDAYAALNEELGSDVAIIGDVETGTIYAEFKA
jgi:DNA polymerase I-like protein with 3'-5' exonuclease and polymerase domains